ncbi:hypothetical protein B484DRAFT_405406 [Ochromonadaceae sp. CCMP2298]|nr:hypothetical protein B484DRAFT_405406 [Ochromonadaceae sp. CCMP2298]
MRQADKEEYLRLKAHNKLLASISSAAIYCSFFEGENGGLYPELIYNTDEVSSDLNPGAVLPEGEWGAEEWGAEEWGAEEWGGAEELEEGEELRMTAQRLDSPPVPCPVPRSPAPAACDGSFTDILFCVTGATACSGHLFKKQYERAV